MSGVWTRLAAMAGVRIATYNVGGKPSDSTVADDVAELRQDSDVVCLQEVADRKKVINPTDHWDLWQPEGDNKEHNAIMWRRSALELVGDNPCHVTYLHEKTWCGPTGAGGDYIKQGWLLGVRWRHVASGRKLHVFNWHAVPSVQGDAANDEGKAIRQDVYEGDIRKIVNRVQDVDPSQQTVFVAGDWNATPGFHLLDPLVNAGLSLQYDPKPTFGDRAIDLIYVRDNKHVAVKSSETIKLHSDHKAARVWWTITEA